MEWCDPMSFVMESVLPIDIRGLIRVRRLSAVPFEARISALLSIFVRRAPGCVPLIAASVEICRHEKVICGAKEAVG
jgi:hypothetical protein